MGLPKIEIEFKKLANTAITRSALGIAVLIVKDNTDKTFNIVTYKNLLDFNEVEQEKFTDDNANAIKDALTGNPAKLIVVRVLVESTSVVADAVDLLSNIKYNWIALADGTATERANLATFAKVNEGLGKTYNAIVFNVANSNCMHVINFTNQKVKYTGARGEITGGKFIPRLLGFLAGLSLLESATYKVFTDLESVTDVANVDTAVNIGEFVLFNDEGVVRVARGVNSLVTLGQTQTEDMEKIIIVASMDLIKDDIRSTFKNSYLGKFKNNYDNQILLISAINTYFGNLAKDDILDNNFNNVATVDIEAQRRAWLESGKTEAKDWDANTVKFNTFRSNVYLAGKIKILDAIEDFKFSIEML